MNNNNTKKQVPVWLLLIGAIAVLWNLMGLFAFYGNMTMSPEALAEMTADQRGLYETQPLWAKIAFGGSVILGVLGSIGLLLRKRWSSILLGLSLVCVMIHTAHNYMSNAFEIMGGGQTFALIIVAAAAFLALFSRWANSKGYFN